MLYYLISSISSVIPSCYHFYSLCTYALIYVETIADYFRMYFLGPRFLPLLTHSILCRRRPLKIYFLTIDSAHVQIDTLGHCYQKWSHFAYVKFKLLWSVNVKKTQSSRLKNSQKKALRFGNYFLTLSASMYSSWTLL